jgi:spore coat protein SA
VLPEIEPFSLEAGAIAGTCHQIFKRLSANNEVTIFSSPVRRFPHPAAGCKVRTVFAGYFRRDFVARRFFRDCYKKEVAFRTRNNFDLVHIFNRPQFVGKIRKRNKRAKIVLHMGNDHLKTKGYQMCERAVHEADLIICNSYYVRSGVVDRFPDAGTKTKLVYSGVDVDQFAPLAADQGWLRNGGDQGELKVLYAGRLTREKGVHLLIEAMKEVFRRDSRVKLELVGSYWWGSNQSTPYIEELKAMARDAGRRVMFRGYVRSDLMPAVYRSADIFIAPSVWQEPFGKVVVEAMACGVPVMASNRGGIPEILGDAGILLDPEDLPKLSASICSLLADASSRRRLGEMGRMRAVQEFNWNRIAPQVDQLLCEIL